MGVQLDKTIDELEILLRTKLRRDPGLLDDPSLPARQP